MAMIGTGAHRISEKGEALIRKWEGFYPEPYYDSVGVLTIGYGTIANSDLGIEVKPGMRIDKARANELMGIELRWMESEVNKLLRVPLNQDQYDAVMSFVYNLGVGRLKQSTLLKRINAKDFSRADDEFEKWVYATDRRTGQRYKLKGLMNRREDEAKLFRGEAITDLAYAPKVKPVPRSVPAQHESEMKDSPSWVGVGGGLMAALIALRETMVQNPVLAAAIGVGILGAGFATYWFLLRKHNGSAILEI